MSMAFERDDESRNLHRSAKSATRGEYGVRPSMLPPSPLAGGATASVDRYQMTHAGAVIGEQHPDESIVSTRASASMHNIHDHVSRAAIGSKSLSVAPNPGIPVEKHQLNDALGEKAQQIHR